MFDKTLISDVYASPCHRALQATALHGTAQSTAALADWFAAALTSYLSSKWRTSISYNYGIKKTPKHIFNCHQK